MSGWLWGVGESTIFEKSHIKVQEVLSMTCNGDFATTDQQNKLKPKNLFKAQWLLGPTAMLSMFEKVVGKRK